jgi:hypothetical protein
MLRVTLSGTLGALLAAASIGCGHQAGPAAPAEPVAVEDRSADCHALIQLKYPFLQCERDESGRVVVVHEPQVLITRQMPQLDPYVESDDYWGR